MFALFITPLLQTFAADAPGCGKPTFLGLVPWYQYLTLGRDAVGKCSVTSFDDSTKVLGSQSPFLLIGLAIIDDLIRIAAMVAVGYIIYGGIQYVTSQGSPDATNKARMTIINALVGLVVAIMATAIVGYLGNRLGS